MDKTSNYMHVKKFPLIIISCLGADVNTKTKDGRTPLHVSAAQGRGPIVDVLLNNGGKFIRTYVFFTLLRYY